MYVCLAAVFFFFFPETNVCFCVYIFVKCSLMCSPSDRRQKIVLQPRADARRQRCMGCIARRVDTNTYNLLPGSLQYVARAGRKKKKT